MIKACSRGAHFINEYICWHKKEELCDCRKPKTGLLEMPYSNFNNYDKNMCWMIGDRATDIIAGKSFGIKTALLGPSVKKDMDVLKSLNIKPDYHGKDLRDFVKYILKS